ncbi:RIP metalloprotease RseP [Cryomorphaceae bacterium 1068]|nr:RIP metalloprotease RseP [Cryomorphaceae bacterium 1068]
MEILIKVSQFLLSLSILIVLHEMGHFIPAKLFKTRVEKFYLFFDPYFSLFKKKVGDTEYGIGWLPLGGYVKISGMIDESMDREQMAEPPKPWEFRSKPAWQRLIIMVGGVTVNVILAFFIYSMMLFAWGKQYIPIENLSYGVYADSLMLDIGFEHGDKIVGVEGSDIQVLNDVNAAVLFGGARKIDIERNGNSESITLPEDIDQAVLKSGRQSLFLEQFPSVVDTVMEGSNAEKGGLKKGDEFVSVDGQDAKYVPALLSALVSRKGDTINVAVNRGGNIENLAMTVSEDGTLGFGYKTPLEFFDTVSQEYGFLESFPAGIAYGWSRLTDYVRSLKLLFSSEGVKQVGGFITIGKLFDDTWNWQRFWNMTAFLSIILAVMNILPIPALDGGHVMFLLYEMVSGRQPNQKVMEYAQLAGIAILLTLLIYANGMDIFRLFN